MKRVEVSADGRTAVTLAGEAKLWDLRTRKEVRTFKQASEMSDFALLPDGRSMVVSPAVKGSANRQNPGDTALRHYDLATGRILREFSGHTWAGASLALNASGTHLASCADQRAHLWDLREGTLLASWPVEAGGKSLAVRSDGKVVAVSSFKGALVRLWDPAGNRTILDLPASAQDSRLVEPEKIGFSEDGSLVFGFSRVFSRDAAGFDHVLYVWDASSGKLRTRMALQASSHRTQNFVDYDSIRRRFVVIKEGGRVLESYDPVTDKATPRVLSALRHDESGRSRVLAGALLAGDAGVLLAISEGDSLWGNVLCSIDFSTPSLVNPMHPSLDVYSDLAIDTENRYAMAWNRANAGIALWNFETGRLDARIALPGGAQPLSHARSGDGQSVYIAAEDSLLKWDLGSRRITHHWKLGWTPAKIVADGEAVLCYTYLRSEYGGGGEYVVFRLDGRTGRIVARSAKGFYSGDDLALSPDGSRLAFAAGFRMPIFDAKTLALIKEIDIGSYAYGAVFLSDNATVAHPWGRALRLIDTATGARTQSKYEYSGNVQISGRSGFFREIRRPDPNDPSRLSVHFRRLSDGQEVERSALPAGDPIALPYLYTASGRDGVARRNLVNGNVVTFLSDSKNGHWVAYDHRGFWDGSLQGGELLAMVQKTGGIAAFQIDQFAVRNNRPDRILESLDTTNAERLEYFRGLYRKRLSRMGLEESGLDAERRTPQVELWGRVGGGPTEQIGMRFQAAGSPLARYQVYVNNVPLFGADGRDFRLLPPSNFQQNGNVATVIQEVPLATGANKIEFSCRDRLGLESHRFPLFAFRPETSGRAKPNLFFLGFGVSDYGDPSIRDLKYAEKDVVDLEEAFKAMQGGRFEKVLTRAVLGREVTRQAIARARDFLLASSVEDTLVLFISGHGIQAGRGPEYYYVTQDARLSDLESTAAPFDLVEALLQGVPAQRKLFLMDTCESGEADEAGARSGLAEASSKGLHARTLGLEQTRALRIVGRQAAQAFSERDRYIHNDLLRRSGAIVLSSSRGNEASLESDALRQGLFTHTVLKAFREKASADRDGNGVLSVRELRSFVEVEVPRLAESLLPGAQQHPVVDRDNLHIDFGF
ncbi:MAG: caspase family protein [Spirochaetes bacterium]|nr:caspase family protein [Spirochaetota bacterium]